MTVAVWALLTKRVGLGSSHGALCRLASSVDYRKPHEVSPASAQARRSSSRLAPRSVARHYFDEHINTPSEFADDGSLMSAVSMRSEWCVLV